MSEVLYKYEKGKGWVIDHSGEQPRSSTRGHFDPNPSGVRWYILFRTPNDTRWRNAYRPAGVFLSTPTHFHLTHKCNQITERTS